MAGEISGEHAAPGPVPPEIQRARWNAVVHAGTPALADGAMGTMLFSSGLQFGDPPEVWNVTQPYVIRRIHRDYLNAGSRIILTNTFGGNRLRLEMHGNDKRGAELNQMAAVLLRAEVDTAGGGALVAGDIGPTGSIMMPLGTLEFDPAPQDYLSVMEQNLANLHKGLQCKA